MRTTHVLLVRYVNFLLTATIVYKIGGRINGTQRYVEIHKFSPQNKPTIRYQERIMR